MTMQMLSLRLGFKKWCATRSGHNKIEIAVIPCLWSRSLPLSAFVRISLHSSCTPLSLTSLANAAGDERDPGDPQLDPSLVMEKVPNKLSPPPQNVALSFMVDGARYEVDPHESPLSLSHSPSLHRAAWADEMNLSVMRGVEAGGGRGVTRGPMRLHPLIIWDCRSTLLHFLGGRGLLLQQLLGLEFRVYQYLGVGELLL